MKGYQITVGGRTFEVRLLSDPRQAQVEVEVDGKTLVVEVQDLDADGSPPSPPRPPAGPVPQAAVDGPSSPPGTTVSGPAGYRTVVAPLPGVVKSIAVRPSQGVGPGDTLLVIEAMKMDNVIRASREGVVETVHVAEGHRVAHGDVLVEYRD